MLMNSREIWRSLQCAPQFARVSQPHMPLRSALPSAVRGAGADRFGLPSAVRGTPGVGCSSHWAEPAPGSATHHITVHSRRDVDRMTAHLRVRVPRYGCDERLPLPELQRHTALDAARYAGDRGAVGRELPAKFHDCVLGNLCLLKTSFLLPPLMLRPTAATLLDDGGVRLAPADAPRLCPLTCRAEARSARVASPAAGA